MRYTYHLNQDLGINKQALKRSFDNTYIDYSLKELKERGLDIVKFLLNKPTQHYTSTEVRLLLREYWTSHDDCVYENEDDFSNIEVYHAKKKLELIEKVYKILNK